MTATALILATTIKLASAWGSESVPGALLQQAAKDIESTTMGRVNIELRLGTLVETSTVRDLENGVLDGALLGPEGIVVLESDSAALMLPALASSGKAWDAVADAVTPTLDASLAKRGYVVIGWMAVGWVRLFAASPVGSLAELAKLGGRVDFSPYAIFLRALGVQGVSGGSSTMIVGTTQSVLESRKVDGSWYCFEQPVGRAYGVMVLREDSLSALSGDDRVAVVGLLRAAQRRIAKAHALFDTKAMKTLVAGGVTVSKSSISQAELDAAAHASYQFAEGRLVSKQVMQAAMGKPTTKAATSSRSAPGKQAKAASNALAAAAAAEAPEDLRALWLAFDECDASMLSLFVQFPLAIGSARFTSAKALAKACKAGTLAWPSSSALEAALPSLQVGAEAAKLVVGERTLRLEWQAQSWMLAGAE